MDRKCDIAVVGGGLVGLATAYALADKAPDLSIMVLEAESALAQHQSGRNSGVVHSGVYYNPGSLKARLCRDGAQRLLDFCETHEIAIDQCGKVIVATQESELPTLQAIMERGTANGLTGLRMLDPAALREIEPHVSARAALNVPEAGVVDFGAVALKLVDLIRSMGHQIVTNFRVSGIAASKRVLRIKSEAGGVVEASHLINCAGLQSDRIAKMAGENPPVKIIPFRGEYYMMQKDRDFLVRHLVYPVPDPRFPFLGIHFTRRIDGSVEVGPNAVLAMGRHHYRGEAGPNWTDVGEMAGSAGLWRLARRYWKMGGTELIRSRSKRLYAAAARELIPQLEATDLVRGGSGIRAQAVTSKGKLADDFVIVENETTVHVLNAPSPAATACLAIGDQIAERMLAKQR
jgi:L-2-hydroxyglutarate oxidase LhgO